MSEIVRFAKLTTLEKCPYCGGELEKGYLHVAMGAFWDTKKHHFVAARGEKIISQWNLMPMTPGLRCKGCKIVIFHYGKF